jgi:pyridoxamine 5'-phosphate oxidase
MTPMDSMRELLRSLPSIAGIPPEFEPGSVPDDPTDLFVAWLAAAIEASAPEPHAMTLSTCDADGRPDGRTLILKDVDADGWWFATASVSAKGGQLASNPSAALTFYWPALARQVRVRGSVSAASRERSAADFRARGIGARAVALAGTQSARSASRDECAVAVRAALGCIEAMPDIASPTWTLYAVVAETVEFWQAEQNRQHIRVQYRRDGDRWTHTMLWP